MTHSTPRLQSVRVWDVPTRVFHWLLVLLVLIGWFSGEGAGAVAQVHRYTGEALAGLLLFRLVWGIIGGEHARFSSFIRPRLIRGHMGELKRGHVERGLGHNPVGAVAVVVLLVAVAAVVVTGLLSRAPDGPIGPLASLAGVNLVRAHEISFRVLQGVVAIHLVGVIATSIISRDNLIAAMVTGMKRRSAGDLFKHAGHAARWALPISATIALVASAVLMALPHR